MRYKREKGITLAELLIVVIIIGILAALALPQFTKSKERAIGKEAVANLKLIAAAEKIYRMEASVYYPMSGGSESDISDINNYLRLSIPASSSRNWDYSVTGEESSFSSTATRASGSYSGCTYTIDSSSEDPVTADCP